MAFELVVARFLTTDVVATLILLVSLAVVRAIAVRAVKARTDAAVHIQRRWLASVRNALFFLGLFGLILIWAPQLRTFALSLTAVAVAIVVATKELILCLSGSVLRATSRSFEVGDWIEVSGVRGEVIDYNLLATTLQEFHRAPHSFSPTGQTVVVPNSAFLGAPVRNMTVSRQHTYHSFAITVEPTVNVVRHRSAIETIVQENFGPYRSGAAAANASMERSTGSDLPSPAPHIHYSTTDLGKHRIAITFFCPPQAADKLETAITLQILERLEQDRPDAGSMPDASGSALQHTSEGS